VSNTVDHDAAVDTDNERIIVINRTSGTEAHVGHAGLLKDQDIDQAWDKQAKAAFVSHGIHWPLAGYSPRCPPHRLLVSDIEMLFGGLARRGMNVNSFNSSSLVHRVECPTASVTRTVTRGVTRDKKSVNQ